MITIYVITGPTQKRYVGKTSRPLARRWRQHVTDALRGKKGCSHFWAAIRKYGAAAFDVRPLWTVETREEADEAERQAIRMLRAQDPEFGYNMTAGGDGQSRGWVAPPQVLANLHKHGQPGRVPTAEERARASARFSGVPLSAEHCKKLSISHKGIFPSKETRAKRSASLKGRKITWGDKLSVALKGRVPSPETLKRSHSPEAEEKRKNTRFLKTVAWG